MQETCSCKLADQGLTHAMIYLPQPWPNRRIAGLAINRRLLRQHMGKRNMRRTEYGIRVMLLTMTLEEREETVRHSHTGCRAQLYTLLVSEKQRLARPLHAPPPPVLFHKRSERFMLFF